MQMLSKGWGRAIRAVTLQSALLLAFQSHTSAQDLGKDAIERLKQCSSTNDLAELKWCVEVLEVSRRVKDLLADSKDDQMAECAKLETVDAIRMCLLKLAIKEKPSGDAASAAATQTPVEPPQSPKREWVVQEKSSRMDGSPTVTLILEADEPVRMKYGGHSMPVLLLRCRENVTDLYVAADWYLDRDVPVMFRLDGDKPVKQTWEASATRKGVGLWSGGSSIPFIKSMLDRKTLLLRVWPFDDAPREMAFSIGGLAKAIEPLRKACKW